MLSMNYVFALLLAVFVLGEQITLTKGIGIVLVTMSVILIGGGKN
jgi:drug/metabolite transporter (DMT)-like permease